jgi:hypothetical protein
MTVSKNRATIVTLENVNPSVRYEFDFHKYSINSFNSDLVQKRLATRIFFIIT